MKNDPEKYISQTWIISDNSPIRLTRERDRWYQEFYCSIRIQVDQTFVDKILKFLEAREEIEARW